MNTLEDCLVQVYRERRIGRLSVAARGAYWSLCCYEMTTVSGGALRSLLGEQWKELAHEVEYAGLGRLNCVNEREDVWCFIRFVEPTERRRVRNRLRMQQVRKGVKR